VRVISGYVLSVKPSLLKVFSFEKSDFLAIGQCGFYVSFRSIVICKSHFFKRGITGFSHQRRQDPVNLSSV
jgi:hypothetical protein